MPQDIDVIDLVLRWLHILAAITLVGGTIFWRFVCVPGLAHLDESTRKEVFSGLRSRWSRLVMLGTALLLISGLVNLYQIMGQYELPRPYHMVFGIKFLIAMVIFYIAARLSGRSPAADRFREKLGFWLNVNLVLAILVVCLAGYLKVIPHTPKEVSSPTARDDTVGTDHATDSSIPREESHG